MQLSYAHSFHSQSVIQTACVGYERCICVCVRACVRVCVCVCVCAHLNLINSVIAMYAYAYMYGCMYVFMYAYVSLFFIMSCCSLCHKVIKRDIIYEEIS